MDKRTISVIIYSIIFLGITILSIPLVIKFLGTIVGNMLYLLIAIVIGIMIIKLMKIIA